MNPNYEIKSTLERIGKLLIQVHSLKDLNKTIDLLFQQVEATDNQKLLEDLCPYFGQVWPSARALAEKIEQFATWDIQHKNVVEIGCGLALPAIVCAKKGATVVATDFHPDVPSFFELNVRSNLIGVEEHLLSYRVFDWTRDEPFFPKDKNQWDWIVGSDILYERQHPKDLANALKKLWKPQTRILIADPGRPYLQSFVDACKELGIEFSISTHRVQDGPSTKDIFLLEA